MMLMMRSKRLIPTSGGMMLFLDRAYPIQHAIEIAMRSQQEGIIGYTRMASAFFLKMTMLRLPVRIPNFTRMEIPEVVLSKLLIIIQAVTFTKHGKKSRPQECMKKIMMMARKIRVDLASIFGNPTNFVYFSDRKCKHKQKF